MSRNLSLYLKDIIKSIDKIQRYTLKMDYESFTNNEQAIDAVIFNWQIIGESVKNISLEVRNKYPQIEWRKIAGLRDIIAHAYFTLDNKIVWDIVQNKISDLEAVVKQMLELD